MMMFLAILFAGLAAGAVCWMMVNGIAPRGEPRPELRPDERIALGSPRFFADDEKALAAGTYPPVELLISEIERHVRLEKAAAESYLAVPSPESLHSPTASPFVN